MPHENSYRKGKKKNIELEKFKNESHLEGKKKRAKKMVNDSVKIERGNADLVKVPLAENIKETCRPKRSRNRKRSKKKIAELRNIARKPCKKNKFKEYSSDALTEYKLKMNEFHASRHLKRKTDENEGEKEKEHSEDSVMKCETKISGKKTSKHLNRMEVKVMKENSDNEPSRKKKKHKLIEDIKDHAEDTGSSEGEEFVAEDLEKQKPKKTLKSVFEKASKKLSSAKFRYLNEQLYRQTGEESLKFFQEDPQAFEFYHFGYRSQVAKWPENPLKKVIRYISKRSSAFVIADLGCGDARLADSVPNVVHSYDLVAVNSQVTVCDITKVPLPGQSIDVAVFCLSLMGKNSVEFVAEANRILKNGGVLLVAEVKSRIPSNKKFLQKFQKLGFRLERLDMKNKMFSWYEFEKYAESVEPKFELPLIPCLYKKR